MGVRKRAVVCLIVAVTAALLFFLPLARRTASRLYDRPNTKSTDAPCYPQSSLRLSPVTLRRTALASFPGSGNSWTRVLLQTATGIRTGSACIKKPIDLSANKSLAARVIAVKTHAKPKVTRSIFPFDRVILLIRNPYEAILAEFNRRSFPGNHVELGGTSVRRPQDFNKEWPGFVSTQMLIWRTFNLAWALDRTPLHVLVYHRMEAQLAPELRHVIRFLNETSISPRVDCAVRAREAHARRKKPDWQRKAAVFSEGQRKFLNGAIDSARKVLQAKTGLSFEDLLLWKR